LRGVETRIGIIGAGFWARYQSAAWQELPDAELVAVADLDECRARELAELRGIPVVCRTVDELLDRARPDVVDVVTTPDAHAAAVEAAAGAGVAIVCQKPLAPSLAEAEALVELCAASGVPLLVHENFRWQESIRALGRTIDAGTVGEPFRARLSFSTSFPVYANQPGLRGLEHLIIADLGVHLLDIARFLFGEAHRVYAETATVARGLVGEDVATIVLRHGSGVVCACELSFASVLEHESFPQTLALVEAERGSVVLAPGYELRVTTPAGTSVERCEPPRYPWADPAYAVVHASMVPCLGHLLESLRDGTPAETSGADNLETLRLMAAAYESAAGGKAIDLRGTVAP
jgi:predicted dehydrogenase